MRMNEYQQELIKQHKQSEELYCCYCIKLKYDKWHCCSENHFMKFSDFDEDAQKVFIAFELEEYESWAAKQGALS